MVAASPEDILSWYLLALMLSEKVDNENQESEPVKQDHNHHGLPKPYQDQNSQNDERTHSKPDMVEGVLKKAKEEFVICLIDNLNEAFRQDKRAKWDNLCIYRIPGYLREKNEWYYPQTISLGPYHYGRAHLLPMDRHKLRAVNTVLYRTKCDIQVYIDAMKELEVKARACYEGTIALNSKDFTKMLLLDGCFVLEYMRGVVHGFSQLGYAYNDPVFAIQRSMHSIQRDMIMLENQLPLFVLEKLLVLDVQGSTNVLVTSLAVQFFKQLMPLTHSLPTKEAFGPFTDVKGLHLLNVFRRSLIKHIWDPMGMPRETKCSSVGSSGKRMAYKLPQGAQPMLYRVTELRDAGIKFKKLDTNMFWDIKFENGYLQIPKLLIHDGTKSLLWNLVTFEQCHINLNNDITVYLVFMDNLIDTSEDVSYLRQRGIIEHSLDSDSEVADMFNGLCKDVIFNTSDNYLSELLIKLHECYKSKYFRNWNAWKRALRHKYFDNPWAYFSFFAAVILLVLTLLQTYFTVYAYYRPRS